MAELVGKTHIEVESVNGRMLWPIDGIDVMECWGSDGKWEAWVNGHLVRESYDEIRKVVSGILLMGDEKGA